MKIALAGNPNSGKTTMYNALTGRNETVGNWAGVTVEAKTGKLKRKYNNYDESVSVVDLPGAYSMSPFTHEESITREYIMNEAPDVIINIVDATNLSRSLFFTTQLTELGIPVVIALNKADINARNKTVLNPSLLSEQLGCDVVCTVSTSKNGLKEIVDAAIKNAGKKQQMPFGLLENDKARFDKVNTIVSKVETKISKPSKSFSDKIDKVLINKWLGIPIFVIVIFAVFWLSQQGPAVWLSDSLVYALELGQEYVRSLLQNASPIITALLVDGVIGGVIAVVGFLPLVMVMYFLLALLEDCGYMARVSVVLDPIFKKVGLSGKSVIPFVMATGCAIPGVMACRTIRNERERKATAMLAPFMPCGAKLPVISLFAGAFFGNASWVGALMYLAGIAVIFFSALIINKITGTKAKSSYFIIELPAYKFPSIWNAFKSMCSRGKAYIVKAATIILVCNTVIQIMQSFTWSLDIAESANTSILATIAGPFAYLLVPIVGVVSWQLAAAAITGFIAKENVVGTLAVCFVGLENLIDTNELELMQGAGEEVAAVFAISKASALAYLCFNLFTPPCFAAIGAMNSELKSKKWLFGAVGFQLGVGFSIGFFVYQIGTLIETGGLGAGFVYGLAFVLVFAVVLAWLAFRKGD